MAPRLPDPGRCRVVLSGVADYSQLDALPGVANNLRRLRELFADPGLWGLPHGNCVVVADDDDPRSIPRAIREAASTADDLVLVYYAGHGLLPPDSDRFCLALPSSSRYYTDTALRYEDVRNAIACAGPRTAKVVILDCCFAARAFEAGVCQSRV